MKELRIENNKYSQTSQTDQLVGEVCFRSILHANLRRCILLVDNLEALQASSWMSADLFTTSMPGG